MLRNETLDRLAELTGNVRESCRIAPPTGDKGFQPVLATPVLGEPQFSKHKRPLARAGSPCHIGASNHFAGFVAGSSLPRTATR